MCENFTFHVRPVRADICIHTEQLVTDCLFVNMHYICELFHICPSSVLAFPHLDSNC